ncbi:MAG: hypothetical protein DMF96_02660 [Acidobacteria bacterium]|nr:MAG: hypothetical protein DMF96_02660 [Acidobacteriota bacterium]
MACQRYPPYPPSRRPVSWSRAAQGRPSRKTIRPGWRPIVRRRMRPSIDPGYDVPAVLKPTDDRTVFQMPTSSGAPRDMRRVGSLEFTLKGLPLKLTTFVEVATPTHLFVAFSDLTSGNETYPAGRYVDIDRNSTGIYEIDFNRAYNPYCYYNPTYECPYPPPENRLKIPVRAGERMKRSEVGSLK